MWGIIAIVIGIILFLYITYKIGILTFILEVLSEIGESIIDSDFDIFD